MNFNTEINKNLIKFLNNIKPVIIKEIYDNIDNYIDQLIIETEIDNLLFDEDTTENKKQTNKIITN